MSLPAIPKQIHLTCRKGELPNVYHRCLDQLRKLHPEWTINIYHDEESRDIIRKYMPSLLKVYDGYTHNIQRADLFRMIVVFLYGGFYLDMDLYCSKPLDSLCSLELVLGEEKTLSEKECKKLQHRYPQRIANYMFGSIPKHAFWLEFIKAMVLRSKNPVHREEDILETTGPGLLTDFYHDNKTRFKNITVLRNVDRVCPNKWCGGISCHFGDFGLHLHVGSWRWGWKDKASVAASFHTGSNIDVEETIRQLDGLHAADGSSTDQELVVLETYNPKDGYFDGLSTVYNRVQSIGEVMTDTSGVQKRKVLTCGIPFQYKDKLSEKNTNILYTTFESDKLPRFWTMAINRYNHCVVPHESVKKVFTDSGVTIPVTVIHQGFTRYKRLWQPHSRKKNFTVGFLGVPVGRKNLLKLYRACRRLKDGGIPEIRLAVHIPFFYEWMNDGGFEEMKNDKMVKWTIGKYDENEISEWYNNLSCYIFPSSGEGWSFTPRESLYLGVPTILSDIPVHRELIESGFCKKINTSGKEPAIFDGNVFGEWCRINEYEIFLSIQDVYNNYVQWSALATQGGDWIEDKWRNDDMQTRLYNLTHLL